MPDITKIEYKNWIIDRKKNSKNMSQKQR